MTNLILETDAYHQSMGYMLGDPMALETYVLYARRGGPQVVSDLTETLNRLVSRLPDISSIAEGAKFWRSQHIPFDEDAWRKMATGKSYPISVRGVLDGEVVRPGDPIAVVTAPAILAGVLEPILIGEQMASMQLATRFTKAACALNWDTQRIFEVGYRAVDGTEEHLRKLKRLQRVGLKATSNGFAAFELGLSAKGTMGHRFTQRFIGDQADYDAFNKAIDRMLQYREEQSIAGPVALSLLLDTRSTLTLGFPAALRVIEERIDDIRDRLALSVRLDSGDLRQQFQVICTALLKLSGRIDYLPSVIVESGLSAQDLADFEQLASRMSFPLQKVLYGMGGFLVSGIDRDAVAAVYKIKSFEADAMEFATMKFGDEAGSAKESYPGDIELWEGKRNGKLVRMLSLRSESISQIRKGFRPLFVDLMRDGVVQASAKLSNEEVQYRVKERWSTVTGNYIGSDSAFYAFDDPKRRRPYYSPALQALVDQLRQQQLPQGQQESVSCA